MLHLAKTTGSETDEGGMKGIDGDVASSAGSSPKSDTSSNSSSRDTPVV